SQKQANAPASSANGTSPDTAWSTSSTPGSGATNASVIVWIVTTAMAAAKTWRSRSVTARTPRRRRSRGGSSPLRRGVRAVALRDRHVFAAATAVVAIHTITDAFVAPEPGVELADHAVSGLVPLALLAGALACFWLNRERLSAVLALVLGLLALEGFALAVADARAVGVRGDDWT